MVNTLICYTAKVRILVSKVRVRSGLGQGYVRIWSGIDEKTLRAGWLPALLSIRRGNISLRNESVAYSSHRLDHPAILVIQFLTQLPNTVLDAGKSIVLVSP